MCVTREPALDLQKKSYIIQCLLTSKSLGDMQVLPNFIAILVTVVRIDLILKWFNCSCILRFWMYTWLMRKFQMNMLAKLRLYYAMIVKREKLSPYFESVREITDILEYREIFSPKS